MTAASVAGDAVPRAWVVCSGEPLPIDPGTPRLLRAGLLCRHLEAAGWEVDFWTASFDHTRKSHRYPDREVRTVPVAPRFRIHLLPSRGYRRNVSVERILDHRDAARAFAEAAPLHPRPDVIVASMPTIDLAHAASRFAQERRIPSIVDLRDLWPEIFYLGRPAPLRWLVQALSAPWSRLLDETLRRADAVVGITDAFVEWGLVRAGRQRRPGVDVGLPLGYPAPGPETAEEERERSRLVDAGVLRPDLFQVAFLGTLSTRTDMDTLCLGARMAARNGTPVHLVVAGTGEESARLVKTYGSDRIRFLGWVGQATLRAVLATSKAGIVPYRNTLDFRMSIPNKAIEYLSAGLPVMTSLEGTLRDLVEGNRVGLTYREGDPASLASALGTIAGNETARCAMSREARRVFQERFSLDVVFATYQRLIERLASARRA